MNENNVYVPISRESDYQMEIIWRNVALFAFLHLGAIYGLILAFTSASWKSTAWGLCSILSVLVFCRNVRVFSFLALTQLLQVGHADEKHELPEPDLK